MMRSISSLRITYIGVLAIVPTMACVDSESDETTSNQSQLTSRTTYEDVEINVALAKNGGVASSSGDYLNSSSGAVYSYLPNGTGWAEPIGGYITGNNKAWNSVAFAPVLATAVRAKFECVHEANHAYAV